MEADTLFRNGTNDNEKVFCKCIKSKRNIRWDVFIEQGGEQINTQRNLIVTSS